MTRLPAIILAGGEARRMGGGDKGLALLAGRPLLDHVLERLSPQAAPLALSANGDPARFAPRPLPVLPDPLPPDPLPPAPLPEEGGRRPGPLAGVLAGLDWAASLGASQLISAPWDAPFLPRDLVARLQAAAQAERTPLAAALSIPPEGEARLHPVVALWDVALRHDLRAALQDGERKVRAWTARHGCAQARFPIAPGAIDPFFNINAPADRDEAEWLLRAAGAPGPNPHEDPR